MNESPYCVAVFGGAVAGSEATQTLIKEGIHVYVFDQNSVPYGKVDFGLPKWHSKLRKLNEDKIDNALKHPLVTYVPECCLGSDLDLEEVSETWGFDAIILATGAWKDRQLPVPGIEKFIGSGFCYQNPFVMWFNQKDDPGFRGETYEIKDNAVVIGGGLSSVDVAKIIMIELFKEKINQKGKDLEIEYIEKNGLEDSASKLGIQYEDLGINGCTIFYRRRIVDMPVSPVSKDPSENEIKKLAEVRIKLMKHNMDKYRFKFRELCNPAGYMTDIKGRFTGMVFNPNTLNGRKIITDKTKRIEVYTPFVVSSIGSIPEPIPGINYSYDRFDIEDEESGKLKQFNNIYVVGNAVTGRGNIKESRDHGHRVTEAIIHEKLNKTGKADPDKLNRIKKKIMILHEKSGYNGNYESWIRKQNIAK